MRPTPCGYTSARLSEFTGTAVFNSNTVTVAPRAYFFCCARKSRQNDALGDAPYCALPRAILFDALTGAELLLS